MKHSQIPQLKFRLGRCGFQIKWVDVQVQGKKLSDVQQYVTCETKVEDRLKVEDMYITRILVELQYLA